MGQHGAVRGSGANTVTPHNTNLITDSAGRERIAEALWIGGAGSGNLSVLTDEGTTQAFAGVPVGWFDKLRVQRVNATGTDVTNIVAIF